VSQVDTYVLDEDPICSSSRFPLTIYAALILQNAMVLRTYGSLGNVTVLQLCTLPSARPQSDSIPLPPSQR
jgi:hypothetical protein